MKRSAWPLAIALLTAPLLVTTGLSRPAAADLIAVANDNHSVNVNGKMETAKNPPPDNVAFIDVSRYPPRLVATVDAPTSVVGAPTAVWIAPDESWAVVTAATKIDPKDATKIIDDDTVSVIDLKASPPKVVQTLHAGKGANEISVDSDGNYALVANRAEGTISAFSVSDKRLTGAGKIDLGNPKSMPSSLKFTPDAESALVTLYGENAVGWLKVAEAKTTVEKHQIVTGVSPYTMDINKAGTLAAVSNMGGGGTGDIGTVSLIDLSRNPPATIDTFAVPASPEGLKFSPDGRFLAVASVNGTTQPSSSPIYHDHGRLWLLAVDNGMLKPITEAPVGRWSQGIAFSKDGKTILVESMIDHGLNVFRWDGKTLTPGKTLDVNGAPAAIRSSWP
jgi:DNA-binding beta-propeller fold protein YncE